MERSTNGHFRHQTRCVTRPYVYFVKSEPRYRKVDTEQETKPDTDSQPATSTISTGRPTNSSRTTRPLAVASQQAIYSAQAPFLATARASWAVCSKQRRMELRRSSPRMERVWRIWRMGMRLCWRGGVGRGREGSGLGNVGGCCCRRACSV